jgi:hypothetical protein
MWEPRRLTALWASTARYRDSFALFLIRGVSSVRWHPEDSARDRSDAQNSPLRVQSVTATLTLLVFSE